EFATIITHIIVLILGFLFGIFSIRQPFQRKTHSDHEDVALFVGDNRCCPICFDRNKSIAFQCGHTFCSQCSDQLTDCPNCRVKVTQRLRLFS
uniref:RING-type domain-containing protein n=1 Tax=Magallana gigas TaxID=29159 RepID=A0A8W8JSN7_MAGGI